MVGLAIKSPRVTRFIVGALTVIASFWIALLIINYMEQPAERRVAPSAEEQRLKAQAVSTANGLRVYASVASDYGPDRAFDGSRAEGSFWEAHNFPIDLVILLPRPATLEDYTLSAGSAADERMPSSWRLEGSLDGETWTTLDRQTRVERWEPDESRNFVVGTKKPVQQLRFQFLGSYQPTILRIYEIELHTSPSN
jgi:hypothetical protein